KRLLLSVLVYLGRGLFVFVPGCGAVVFFVAPAYRRGRHYFELAAMRFHPPAEAKALRKRHQGTVFTAGLMIAAFVSIPIVNLATPLFGTALMVHMHKRLGGSRAIEQRRWGSFTPRPVSGSSLRAGNHALAKPGSRVTPPFPSPPATRRRPRR